MHRFPFLFRLAVSSACVAALPAGDAGAQAWSYLGETGPEHWGELDPGFATCAAGTRQSPVDLGLVRARARLSPRLAIHYGETEGEIFDNGHTIEVETEGLNTLELDGVEYELVQFHFHTPSEHTFRSRGWDMELHLVHRNAEGGLAVIGVLLRRGSSSGALGPIFERLPDAGGTRTALEAFDPSSFLPRSRWHFRYSGSLTTPPCSEGVRWMVMLEPLTVSDEHMAQFNERIRFNARPVQR